MTPPPRYRGRFAPSPTGPLHFGSLVAALGSWMMARRAGGEWWVRIEDVDRPREVPGAADRQLNTLAAFGMASDGPVLRQSQRGDLYQAALSGLLASGDAFPCRCSRSALAATGGIHRACVDAGDPARAPSVRLRVPDGVIGFEDELQGHFEQDVGRAVGDFVLWRADGLWAYQLAVVVDDADQGITHVVRGADLLDSTPRQILLQRRLGLPTPAHAHLPLVLGADGRKLGKSLQALPIDDDAPWPALRAAWRFLGQPDAALDAGGAPGPALERAATRFDPARIPVTDGNPDSGFAAAT
ncbi:MAG TPA: tRNA glutamyl-Q(34) synthetase GluQRS [Arenimonas sp.]|uniref:tRNA glutamyl-Q(34) synthetase GluQRS n=1 Tax=Arenimonas sp. TaxID=1872635 RepID=UPI002D7FA32C|nr:tRNA glutamyl-Q(34) synthetase GluQRS [Arenimonas sp.]HEU0152339.1 tRNA glutamyl-Q(34) synthetase GluQRS [Arenimonas sp.]